MTTPTILSRLTRSWLHLTITGLAAALLLAISFPTMAAAAADETDPPRKKERPKIELPDFPDIEEMMKNLQLKGIGQQEMEELRRELQKTMKEIRQLPGMPGVRPLVPVRSQGRLGVNVSKPSDVLADQLDLPKGKGLVIDQVTPDSAADKAGLKANDILLELDGKPVPNDPAALSKMVAEIKANQPITVVVFRKGKKVTIKELSLPAAKVQAVPGKQRGPRVFEIVPPGRPGAPKRIPQPIIPKIKGIPGGQGMVMTNVTRIGDQFTAGHQDGTLHISITGTIEEGKAKVKTIVIQDESETQTYQTVDKVDEKYRDKVKRLIKIAEMGEGTRIELQTR